jgi:RNA polymerase sigma factor (sigma-70 family)
VDRIEGVYRERFEQFAKVAAGITGDDDAGRDAVQMAFAIALRERASFRGDGSLDGWLWRIVVNEAKRLARRRHALPLQEVHEPISNGDELRDELGLRAWISSLPERQRMVLFLRYYGDLDYRAIGEILQIEVGTVSATLTVTHKKLRKLIREVER